MIPLGDPDGPGWDVNEGRVRAVRSQPAPSGWRSYYVAEFCWHGVPLKEHCDLCVADINYLKETA